jgi:uncharacterized protein (TIGR02145 family)
MMKKIIKISVLVLFVTLVINGCKKGDYSPINPYNGKTTAVFNPGLTYGTMTDQDSNVYKTITIGTQTWMAENLRTTKYRDGSSILNITDNRVWTYLTTGAYCNYNNTKSADTIATYGRLYDWYAATDSRNIAPTGWHVPTVAEWTTLTTYLGGDSVAGGKIKETGTTHWATPNIAATNESGFTALPSGTRYYKDGSFFGLGGIGVIWSSAANTPSTVYLRDLYNEFADFYPYLTVMVEGSSLRLIKD